MQWVAHWVKCNGQRNGLRMVSDLPSEYELPSEQPSSVPRAEAQHSAPHIGKPSELGDSLASLGEEHYWVTHDPH